MKAPRPAKNTPLLQLMLEEEIGKALEQMAEIWGRSKTGKRMRKSQT
jgi:hypothetical protein